MSGAIVSFTAMAIAGRAVSLELDTFEIMLYRSLIGVLIVTGLAAAAGTLGEINRAQLGVHVVRNAFHFAGQNLWFYAITVAPLAQVFALEFSLPIWVMLMAPLVLGERLTAPRVAAALVGFAGILIVARPELGNPGPGIVAAALAAIGFAGSAVFTRLLTRTQTITCILFWLVLLQSVFGLVIAGHDGEIALPSAAAWPWIGLIACAGLVAHFCLATALRLAPATVVMPVDFLRLPVIAVIGMAVYGEPLDPFVFLGAAVIFAAAYGNIAWERKTVTKA